ncbi:bifunctional enoyl-CoA hydratase/phosphate acetyltransferase [Pseudodonghicola flavimaris]|uniref:Bifunctional enoyl-CoA hydratase/phosphate acetyltransferase n=1 Tax=Pseudodonghicola flavimaris TaxID=3050036 RepID=A0ABT7F338_9RHOB|nr:bifunctional enoyl-CoA hydratase/phosphate acetyltransferase [Pseudodonghicola flavimaris]MDK3019023.1 bifunctional enoyl-CoA hydratase/phosphate acetyltransferase [Pseudodonghicola flavimaris]
MTTPTIQNVPFDQLEIGMEAAHERTLRAEDLFIFANSSGNMNPMHLPEEDGDGDGRPEAVAPGMWIASLISSVLGCELPGPGTLYHSQTLRFIGRAHAGDALTVKVRLTGKGADRLVTFDTWVETTGGSRVLEGEAEVYAPEKAMSFKAGEVPGLTLQRHVHFDRILEMAEPLAAIPTAVVAPEKPDALAGAILAAEHTLIDPVLVGHAERIAEAAAAEGIDLSPYRIVDVRDHALAAQEAVRMVRAREVAALMKGHLHTDVLLHEVVKRDGGLRKGGRKLSHVFVMDVPGLDHLLMVTDAAINIAPDLAAKADIVQNAIDLAHALGIEQPKVGVLSAVEVVNPAIPSTLDAAALSKMAERGQITGGLVDGPLAMDNAVDIGAAATKGIHSLVAGRAEILMAPNLEAGNMLAKELTFLAHAEAGGVVMGAKCPIILTSRADDDKARLVSCAVAALAAHASGMMAAVSGEAGA